MRFNAHNDVDFEAYAAAGSDRVKMFLGPVSFTATTADALELARQLVEAVRQVESREVKVAVR
ncbi:hypothetical protein MMUR_05510 [Mycolicibacterium murale]|uniref:Uncharacterized protein n=1 Tax=Mycolicibacterium murale TaxID=182220 RepID=A0A7I9WF93_9MYCO|nr:hypothetical protein [Mycolicibacterium murale]MCV7182865.1 hypothetical protein [Mycolicibacterium murale]GFG56415.1 hypothetical protein MMUR_05510 [Mycolicibacterium murale]